MGSPTMNRCPLVPEGAPDGVQKEETVCCDGGNEELGSLFSLCPHEGNGEWSSLGIRGLRKLTRVAIVYRLASLTSLGRYAEESKWCYR